MILKIYKKIPGLLIQGILALLPLIITLYTANIVIKFFENIVDNIVPFLPEFISANTFFVIGIEIIFFIFAIVFIVFFGLIARSVIGKSFLKLIQSFFLYIPGLNTVYKASEQVISVIAQGKQPFYHNPVLIEYPTPGIWAIAFSTGEIELKEFTDGKKRFTVFIPTTPNPTSGFLAIMPEDKIKKLDINAEDVLKLILTGGIIKNINEEIKVTKK